MRIFGLLLLLSACSATGPAYKDVKIPVNSQSSAVVVYRPNATPLFGEGGLYSVDINGAGTCKLHNSSFMVANNLSGVVNITSSVWSEPGTSHITIKTMPGKISYVRMTMNDERQAIGILGGYAGVIIAEGLSSQDGPFIFTHVGEKEALNELSTLKLEEDCI